MRPVSLVDVSKREERSLQFDTLGVAGVGCMRPARPRMNRLNKNVNCIAEIHRRITEYIYIWQVVSSLLILAYQRRHVFNFHYVFKI